MASPFLIQERNTTSVLIVHLVEMFGSLAFENKPSLASTEWQSWYSSSAHFWKTGTAFWSSHSSSTHILAPVPNCLDSGPQLFTTVLKNLSASLSACLWMSTIYSCHSSIFTKYLPCIMHSCILLAISLTSPEGTKSSAYIRYHHHHLSSTPTHSSCLFHLSKCQVLPPH